MPGYGSPMDQRALAWLRYRSKAGGAALVLFVAGLQFRFG